MARGKWGERYYICVLETGRCFHSGICDYGMVSEGPDATQCDHQCPFLIKALDGLVMGSTKY